MKATLVALLLTAVCLWGYGQKIPPKPNPPRLVNDLTKKTLEPDQIGFLERKLVAYDDTTSVQIAIVIVSTLQDYEPVDYAVKLGREWGVGNKKTNNGVVLLVSTEEGKRRVFIAPGYGLEGALPDITCKQIVENEILPEFRQGNYFRGLDKAATAIIKATRGEYTAPKGYANRGEPDGIVAFIIVAVVLMVLFFIIASRSGGGPGGGMHSRRGYRNYSPPIFWFPTGGGGGGGGFGGFGGGSFGGGGAGGSW
jgi:uncharacterized protein